MIRRSHFACVTVLAGNEYIVRVFVVVVASAMTVAVTYILARSTMSL